MIERLYREQAWVLTRQQALTHLTEEGLRHRVESGRWRLVQRGIYVAHSGPVTPEQQLWIAVLANGKQAVLAGLTAAVAGGLRRDGGGAIHVLVPSAIRSRRANHPTWLPRIVVHRTSTLPARDVLGRARPPRTAMARSVVDAAQWAPTDDEARALVAAACRQRRTTPERLLEVVTGLPRAHRRSVLLETIGLTARGAEALSEMTFVRLCERAGLPAPDQQVARRDASGRLRFLDNRWREYRVVAEVDGSWHTDPAAWWDDMWRQNDIWMEDEVLLRFPAWALRHRQDDVIAQLTRALRRGGWRPNR